MLWWVALACTPSTGALSGVLRPRVAFRAPVFPAALKGLPASASAAVSSSFTAASPSPPPKSARRRPRAAIVTGGTRGIGRGIAEALASEGRDLLLTYASDDVSARETARAVARLGARTVVLVRGDLSRSETRAELFARFDAVYGETHDLDAVVHNAGQYVGITAANDRNLSAQPLAFGDATLVDAGGAAQLEQMHYYQQLYGDAFVDLCERALARVSEERGAALVGISSPGCTTQYHPNLGYDMPGAGKCVMEYAMRLYALRAAARGVTVNVVVPGVTETRAWDRLAGGEEGGKLARGVAKRVSARARVMHTADVARVVGFLCSEAGRAITGVSLPLDGTHLRA